MTYRQAGTLWWDGRFHQGKALHGSEVVAQVPPGTVRLPGTLLPGLTDAHVHLGLADLPTIRAGGIAEVWDLGGTLEFVRRQPGIRYAGQFLTAPGGYPSDRAWAPAGSWREVGSPGEAADAVSAQTGASFIKATLNTGGPILSLATLAAIADAAHAAGLPLIVHAEGPGTVETALDAGADLLAHTPWTEALDEGVIRAAAGQTTWISTLDIHGWGAPTADLDVALGNLRRFLARGGTVRYGTDLGNGPLVPGINPREIRALQQAGLTPAEILTAMSPSAATLPPSWIPGGLDLDPARFAGSLATARAL
ncbi:amidohydrolase family protein [Actinoplanes sp. NPDC049265]|uniref:amidohydrolase family protein n=1 Tax=Actinoplanes sp. NPDC049265 TaxID=3363902 RepID=UPI00371E7578